MSRRERGRSARPDRITELLSEGAHAAAREAAQAMLADSKAPEGERGSARAALASLRPEPGAVAVGLVGVALATGVALWAVLQG